MKAQKKILALTISALLMAGAVSYATPSYAGNDSSKTKKVEEKKKADSAKTQSASGTDSDKRGSSNTSDQKITICHVPPGNPANKHTIHIAYSAWAAHKTHTNSIGPDYVDYLGSCNSKVTSPDKETIHVISGCTGTARETLESKVQAYYEPITVSDTALDDESVVTAMSQCLDNGDSSDSGHGDSGHHSASSGKGNGHDSVSDSGNHHRIRGCQDKSSGDSSQKYNKKLKSADSNHDTAHSTKDPVIVSDSSLDDKDVWKEFKTCVADDTNPNKIDSSKTGKRRGDSGHKQYILKSCGDTQDQKVRDAVTTYKAKSSTKDIIITASAYNDVTVKAAVDACVSAGAKDTPTDTFSPNVAIKADITCATVTNAEISGSKITGGSITAGTSLTANVIGGVLAGGTVSGGTMSGTTLTCADITAATVSTQGVSGRLNFRENTAPVTDTSSSSTTSTSSSSTTSTSTTGGTGILAP